MANCKYCQKEVKPLGLSMHQKYCKSNPNRLTKSNGGQKKGCTTWNKGIKTHYGEKISDSLRGKSKGVANTPEKEAERKRKISETMKKNPDAGGLREGSGRGVKTWYNSPIAGRVYLRSTYEIAYARYLDENRINWRLNSDYFEYFYEENIHKYYPDFYLVDENCFVEVKGFKTKKDEAKWIYFPHKLKVLYEKDIRKLEGYQSDLLDRS